MADDADPYTDLVSELHDVLARGKYVQRASAQKGVVSDTDAAALQDACDAADELLILLRQAVQVVTDRGGKVHGKVFSANEILERQNTIREGENELTTLRNFCRDVNARRQHRQRTGARLDVAGAPASLAAATAITAPATTSPQSSWPAYGGNNNNNGSGAGATDDFLLSQEHMQRQEQLQQDEVLDRLTYGLAELRDVGTGINSELSVQHTMLGDVERNVSRVQLRLRAANEKVDRLLRSMSNRGKICTICVLMVVLVLLLVLTFQ